MTLSRDNVNSLAAELYRRVRKPPVDWTPHRWMAEAAERESLSVSDCNLVLETFARDWAPQL